MTAIDQPAVRPFPETALLDDAGVRAAAKEWLRLRRRLMRAAYAVRRDRLHFAPIRRPVWALRHALGAYRAYGAELKAGGLSPLRQVSQVWWNQLRYDAARSVIGNYAVLALSQPRAARLCMIPGINMPQVYKLLRAVSDVAAAETLADKRRFSAWCESHAIPAIRTIAELEAGSLLRIGTPDGALPPESLFSKWGAAFGGYDTAAWEYRDGGYGCRHGPRLTATELIDWLALQSRSGLVLLQPRLVNHAEIARLSPCALSTMRLMTMAARGESPMFLAGLLRMGTGDATADNFAQGGIAAPIDYRTGVLGEARGVDARDLAHAYSTHPDTGTSIVGTRIPFWRESIDLALRAHAALGDVPVVGWDIAVTPGGPVLVEGNWNPCIKLFQVATQTPLLATALAPLLLERLRAPLRAHDDRWLVSVVA
jgi:hypothetical protein